MPQVQMTEAQLNQTAQQYSEALRQKDVAVRRFERIISELTETVEALNELDKMNGKFLVKIGTGVFVEVEAKNIKKCKRGFSENGFVEEKTEDTVKWLEEKKNALIKNVNAEKQDMAKIESRLNEMIHILEKIAIEKQKNFSGK
jgi:prefoldin alpha subunit